MYRKESYSTRYLLLDLTVGRIKKNKLDPQYLKMGLSLFSERYRRGLSKHDEFSKMLSDHDRSALWQSNQAVASALTLTKV